MLKSLLAFIIALVATGIATWSGKPGKTLSAGADNRSTRGEKSASVIENLQVSLTCDKMKTPLQGIVALDVAIRNNGPHAVYLFQRLEWGDGGGLLLHVRNGKRDAIGPHVDPPWPPPPDDQMLLLRLGPERFYGLRGTFELKRLVSRPGRYTFQVEYRSPVYRDVYGTRFQALPVLWYEDGSVDSNVCDLEVIP